MSTLGRILVVVALVVVLGGITFLITWDIPPPTARVERVIPDEELSR